MRVRKVTSGDRADIVSIINGCDNLSAEEKNCAVELVDIYLSSPGQGDYYFIAAVDGDDAPAGYVCYGPRPLAQGVYDMYWIVVDKGKRRSGVGRALLEHTVSILKEEGARIILAETSGLPEYGAAREFYSMNGFAAEARIKGFYKPQDDLVIYVKRL